MMTNSSEEEKSEEEEEEQEEEEEEEELMIPLTNALAAFDCRENSQVWSMSIQNFRFLHLLLLFAVPLLGKHASMSRHR